MDEFDPPMRVALDHFSVPALPPAFGAQVVAMATATADRPPPRRDRRGGWVRKGLLIGGGALILASATAAATGIFGPLPHTLPELAHVFVAAPPPVVTAHPRKAVALRKAVPAPALVVAPQAGPPAIDLLTRRAVIRDRLLAIRAARIAAGEPVRPLPGLQPQDRAALIAHSQAFAAAHPVIAARIAERVRERRDARSARMGREGLLQGPLAGVDGSASALAGPPPLYQSPVAGPDDATSRLERLRRLRERWRAARMDRGPDVEP